MNAKLNGPVIVEDDIDAALKLLAETQAPAAIASRVHRKLETAAMSHDVRSRRRFLIPAAGMAMATVVLVVLFSQMHRTQEHRASAVATAKFVPAAPTKVAIVMPSSAAFAAKRSEEGKRSVQLSSEGRVRHSQEYRHAPNLLNYPLTRQEKLLLRFVRSAKPADLQALNPEYQAKVEAQQEAEFAAYLKSGSSPRPQDSTQTNNSKDE